MSVTLKYAEADIYSSDRLTLLLQVYEGTINFMQLAIIALERNDIKEFCTNILKAQDCVLDLIECLDFKVSEDICSKLYKVYDAVLNFLTEANLKRDPKPIKDSINCIQKLASAYKDIQQKLNNSCLNPNEKIDLEFKLLV